MGKAIEYRRLVHKLFDREITADELREKVPPREQLQLFKHRARPSQIDRKMAAAGERA